MESVGLPKSDQSRHMPTLSVFNLEPGIKVDDEINLDMKPPWYGDVQVEPGMKVVVQSLAQLFSDCASVSQAPGKRREMDKASQVLGALFWSLNEG